jgi:hypothetical protein
VDKDRECGGVMCRVGKEGPQKREGGAGREGERVTSCGRGCGE